MADTFQIKPAENQRCGKWLPTGIDRSIFYGILFISIVTLLAYSSVFSAGFIWDDDDHVIRLMDLSSIDGLFKIWFEPGATIQYYPLVFSAFWAQIKLWGLDPFGFHLVNISLHVCNALLLWYCLKRLEITGAFWAGCLFAIHPMHVESVAWVTELKNLLSAFFYLLAFLSYWNYSELHAEETVPRKKVRLYYFLALLLFCFALLSKTVTCTFPAAVLLLFWWKRGRITARETVPLIPFFVLAIVLGMLTLRVETEYLMAKGSEWDTSLVERVLIAGRVIWFHLGKLLWPYPLIFNYPRWHIDASEWWQYLFPVSAVSILVLLWQCQDRFGRGLLAACLFTIGTNFPALGFFNVYSMRYSFVADHYYYIANVGVFVLVCVGGNSLQQKISPPFKHAATAGIGVVFLSLMLLTWSQGRIYKDRLTLFTDTIEKNPRSWLSYTNRGRDYALSGQDDLALADVEKSLGINPDDADALQIRGAIALKRRDFERAIADMSRSVQLYPDRVEYVRNRSLAYRNAGRLQEAIADASHVIKLSPQDFETYLYRASLYAVAGNLDEASADLEYLARIGFEITAEERKLILSPR